MPQASTLEYFKLDDNNKSFRLISTSKKASWYIYRFSFKKKTHHLTIMLKGFLPPSKKRRARTGCHHTAHFFTGDTSTTYTGYTYPEALLHIVTCLPAKIREKTQTLCLNAKYYKGRTLIASNDGDISPSNIAETLKKLPNLKTLELIGHVISKELVNCLTDKTICPNLETIYLSGDPTIHINNQIYQAPLKEAGISIEEEKQPDVNNGKQGTSTNSLYQFRIT
jgi:hypothetical protein